MATNIVDDATALTAKVARLERDHEWAISMLGTVLSTLVISRNRQRMLDGDQESIQSLISLSDHWWKTFLQRTGNQPDKPESI